MREESLIRKVKLLVESYSFNQPFAVFLREHFRKHPEMGSRDRRETREWSFSLFRIGKNLENITFEKRLSVSCFLCCNKISPALSYLLKTYSEFSDSEIDSEIESKIVKVIEKYPSFNLENIFSMRNILSPQIKRKEWYFSFLKKPKVHIRIRRKFLEKVINELVEKTILFSTEDDPLILSFDPDIALEKTLSFQKGYFEVQDKSSQRCRDFFNAKSNEYWWDVCAGAGGKSLLLMEEAPDIKIFASDIRESILKTYTERMKKSGYSSTKTKVLDLTSSKTHFNETQFDGIIADVPCSGSGTWSRSPEWLQRDLKDRLFEHFIPLQRSIVSSVLPSLKVGSPFIYITCSVFKLENEDNIEFFVKNFPFKLEKTTYLEGYESGADSLFIARLIKV